MTFPYEIHITVQDVPNGNAFKRACEVIGVKPILLALQSKTNGTLKDVMTSSVVIGTIEDAHIESRRIEHALRSFQMYPIRRKIETIPWNPIVEVSNGPSNYFEAHISIEVNLVNGHLPRATKEQLREDCSLVDLHLSSNQFKNNTTTAVYMTTLREYDTTYDAFKNRTEAAIDFLEGRAWQIKSHVVEFAVFDSNVDHDKEWMK